MLPLPGIPHYTIAVLKPQSFDEATQAVDALKAGTVILLNLASLGADKAQRFADFAAGSACALSGHQKMLGNHIFLFAPPMVQIVTQLKTA
ncbi:MAG: cell division protein SepF [Acaryochloridaceae cyanobacterium SU_2_1]|nr:cell division protein SepF [Acaryochloridaceae cyanobacterium SU_2_1]